MGVLSTGRFITLEGGEGAGKSTQARLLAERLRGRGIEIVATREPGGTPGAEAIRGLLVEGEVDRWLPLGETLLHVAARHDHTERLIRPALARGAWVVCDRYLDSTFVYQGVAGGIRPETIATLHAVALGGLEPDLTLVLDIDPERGLRRRGRAGGGGRYERMGKDFHEKVRQGFIALAAAETQRCVLIDADRAIDAVADDVWRAVGGRLKVVP